MIRIQNFKPFMCIKWFLTKWYTDLQSSSVNSHSTDISTEQNSGSFANNIGFQFYNFKSLNYAGSYECGGSYLFWNNVIASSFNFEDERPESFNTRQGIPRSLVHLLNHAPDDSYSYSIIYLLILPFLLLLLSWAEKHI